MLATQCEFWNLYFSSEDGIFVTPEKHKTKLIDGANLCPYGEDLNQNVARPPGSFVLPFILN